MFFMEVSNVDRTNVDLTFCILCIRISNQVSMGQATVKRPKKSKKWKRKVKSTSLNPGVKDRNTQTEDGENIPFAVEVDTSNVANQMEESNTPNEISVSPIKQEELVVIEKTVITEESQSRVKAIGALLNKRISLDSSDVPLSPRAHTPLTNANELREIQQDAAIENSKSSNKQKTTLVQQTISSPIMDKESEIDEVLSIPANPDAKTMLNSENRMLSPIRMRTSLRASPNRKIESAVEQVHQSYIKNFHETKGLSFLHSTFQLCVNLIFGRWFPHSCNRDQFELKY